MVEAVAGVDVEGGEGGEEAVGEAFRNTSSRGLEAIGVGLSLVARVWIAR